MDAASALHPTDQTLQSYGLGKLDGASAESVDQHLEGCPDCRRRVAALSSDSFLGRLRDARAGAESRRPAVSSTDGLSMLGAATGAADPPPPGSLPPGLADHPDYEILRELGRGGMGVVYLAQNRLMGRPEVLKVVGAHLISRPAVLDRFLREIRAAARLHHPNIVTAYSALRLGESLVLSMEYVEGLDLSRVVRARGPIPVPHACNYVHQAALGLQHAHEHGMVHRDIKPANLVLARSGGKSNKAIVKVLDFGLAKVTSEGQRDSGLTREGQMLGTPDYIAPEQIRDAQSADIRADIYSLGCTLYYLLSGGPPFRGDNLWDIYQAHFSMDASPLNLSRPEVPVELAALVAKMMAKEPGRRFREPRDVAQALSPFFRAGGAGTRGRRPDVSRAEPPRIGPAPAAIPSPPIAARAEPTTSPAPPVREIEPASLLMRLIDLRDHEPADRAMAPVAAGRRRPMVWKVATGGAVLLGIVVAWAAVTLTAKTKDGILLAKGLAPGEGTASRAEPAAALIPPAGDPSRYAEVSEGSEWRIEDGVLYQKRPHEVQTIVFGDPNWTEYELMFEAKKLRESKDVTGFGAMYNVNPSTDSRYTFHYSNYANGEWSNLLRYVHGQKTQIARVKIQAIDTDRWYKVAIRVRRGHVEIRVDGVRVIELDDDAIEHGKVGLVSSWYSACAFRKIRVSAPDDTVLWEGLPHLPGSAAGASAADSGASGEVVNGVAIVDFTKRGNPGCLGVPLHGGVKDLDDLSFRMTTAYTDTTLVLTFEVRDNFIDAQLEDAARPQLNDSIEVFCDGDRVANDFLVSPTTPQARNREGFQLIADTLGHKYMTASAFDTDDWTVTSRLIPGGYVLTFSIPLRLIDTEDGPGYTPAGPGSRLRFNVGITDNDRLVSGQDAYGILWRAGDRFPVHDGEDTWDVELLLDDGTAPGSTAPYLIRVPWRPDGGRTAGE